MDGSFKRMTTLGALNISPSGSSNGEQIERKTMTSGKDEYDEGGPFQNLEKALDEELVERVWANIVQKHEGLPINSEDNMLGKEEYNESDPPKKWVDKELVERLLADNIQIGKEEIENRFGFHKATVEGENATLPKHNDVHLAFREFAEFLDKMLPEGRAKSVAFTELENASMWSHKAIAETAPLISE